MRFEVRDVITIIKQMCNIRRSGVSFPIQIHTNQLSNIPLLLKEDRAFRSVKHVQILSDSDLLKHKQDITLEEISILPLNSSCSLCFEMGILKFHARVLKLLRF